MKEYTYSLKQNALAGYFAHDVVTSYEAIYVQMVLYEQAPMYNLHI